MGKQGPCYHCGITTTPLWRNGPPEKPVLCNACGSRWRTKGTLINYMPMHSGGFGVGSDKARWNSNRTAPEKTIISRKRKEPSDGNSESALSKTSTYFSTSAEDDASTRSSLGSEVSTFDGPFYRSAVAPVRGTPWDTPVPSRRRTNMFRSRASSDKIARNLVSLEEQEVSSVTCPENGDAVVLFETKSPLVAVEIGLGSVFIRQPAQQIAQQQEHESEASSLLIDSGTRGGGGGGAHELGEVPSQSTGLYNSAPLRGKEKLAIGYQRPETHYNPSRTLLESFPYNKRNVLQSKQSPLNFLELKDVINDDTFTELLTDQEQLQLLKFLSSVDISHCPQSLSSMFSSSQFERAVSNFQRLLSEGMFDSPEAGSSPRVLQHYQQLLSVTDLPASGWAESLSQLQNQARTSKRRAEPPCGKEHKLLKPPCAGNASLLAIERTDDSKLHGTHKQHELNHGVSSSSSKPSQESSGPRRATTSSFLPESTAIPARKPVKNNLMEEGHDSGGEQDLLVNVPSSMSFRHDAELLLLQKPPSMDHLRDKGGNGNGGSNASGGDCADLIVTNTWHSTDWDGFLWTSPASARGGGSTRRRVLPNGTVLNP
ncbi:GATA transcription factor 27-like isoform X2 [Selaginella moellendorffii]|uniref:GATA transcription factor 27-like isoform X2 n=1 Tax=Selaginella moellendorffii TaxID=88036 RepID=UPI000D1C7C6B|nr:GATA transcription factor 27-like isoform X2 [Selaginella moellendorffii]|eukprot:XP_024526059.1 GATA transcription factor 27-like isoform X2 [Selaginella moellendorffii]